MRRISLCCVLLAQAVHYAGAAGCDGKVANMHESGMVSWSPRVVADNGGNLCTDQNAQGKNGTWKRTEKPEGGADVHCKFTSFVKDGPIKYNCYRVCTHPPQGGPMKEPYCGGCCSKHKCMLETGLIATGGGDCIGAGSCKSKKHNRKLWLQEIYSSINMPQRNLDSWNQGHREKMRDRLCEVFQEEARGGAGCNNGKCDQAFIDQLKADFEKEKKVMMDIDNKIRGKQYAFNVGCSCGTPGGRWIPPWVEWDKIPKHVDTKGSGDKDYCYDGWPCGVYTPVAKTCGRKKEEEDALQKALKDAGTNWKTFYKGPYVPAKPCPLVCGGALTTGGGSGASTAGGATGLVASLGLLALPFLSFWV